MYIKKGVCMNTYIQDTLRVDAELLGLARQGI